jgi:hypothetical protein
MTRLFLQRIDAQAAQEGKVEVPQLNQAAQAVTRE